MAIYRHSETPLAEPEPGVSWPLWGALLISITLGIDPKSWADLASAAMGFAEIVLTFLGA